MFYIGNSFLHSFTVAFLRMSMLLKVCELRGNYCVLSDAQTRVSQQEISLQHNVIEIHCETSEGCFSFNCLGEVLSSFMKYHQQRLN